MSFTRRTFRELTPPGYFDFSANQTTKTAAMVSWFDANTAFLQEQVRRFENFFRLWATVDYTDITPSSQLYLCFLARQIGFPILPDLNVVRDLVSYLLSPRPESFSDQINQLYSVLLNVGWITEMGQVIAGTGSPINFAETLTIYSSSVSQPALPGDTFYIRHAWAAPAGWTKAPASSNWVARGYVFGTDIIWAVVTSTATPPAYYNVAALADLPSGAGVNVGDICGVYADGSGDIGSLYVRVQPGAGGRWVKFSTRNNLQGSVFTDSPVNSSGLWAPDSTPPVTSQTPPPVSGPSQGYGFYGLWGNVGARENLSMFIILTDEGNKYLGIIINLFRRIKPAVAIGIFLYATYGLNVSVLPIKDLNAIT